MSASQFHQKPLAREWNGRSTREFRYLSISLKPLAREWNGDDPVAMTTCTRVLHFIENHKDNDEMGMPGPALNDHVGVGVDTPFHSKTLGKQWNGDDRFRPRDRHLTLHFILKP